MTYDDLKATDIIRQHWADLIKHDYPDLYAYITAMKSKYPNLGEYDKSSIMTIDEAILFVTEQL